MAQSSAPAADGAPTADEANGMRDASVRSSSPAWSRRALLLDIVVIAGLHALACVVARVLGFDHVSDDDFARVTIAQMFARAPRLDPSGTSWLPAPFWVLGGLMAVLGRSLAVAHAASIALSSLAAAAPFFALRFAGVPRGHALAATALTFATPWAIWLGAATVPESFTASLTAAGVIGLTAMSSPAVQPSAKSLAVASRHRAPVLFGLAIALACLSRYEPWPVAAALAIALVLRAARVSDDWRLRRACAIASVLCALGPVAWMAWNAHAHDGPLHFFRRVAGFKRAIGEGATDTLAALLLYPRLLLTTRAEVAFPALLLIPAALRDPSLRRRWALPLLCVAAQIAFLAYGNARDGAPAHHPERALLGSMVLLALFVGDVTMSKLKTPLFGLAHAGKFLAGGIGLIWLVSFACGAEIPGRSPGEDRREQLARGANLRASGVMSFVVTPCAFEHFALLAAHGAPEGAKIEPRTNVPVTAECPRIDTR